MPRIDDPNGSDRLAYGLAIYVYADHLPRHFHAYSSATNCNVSLETLEVIEGTYSRRELLEIIKWISKPENKLAVEEEWRRRNDRE